MDVLKVFVNSGTNTGSTIDSMVEGDILLVKASDNSKVTAAIGSNANFTDDIDVRIVTKTAKGLVFSTPFNRKTVSYVNYRDAVAATEKSVTATLKDVVVANILNKTFTLGVQIKEDLRMGTYNRNTEILGTHVAPSTAYADVATAMKDITSSIAKGFAANPLTSTSPTSVINSPQLVKVERVGSGTITALGTGGSTTFAVTQGTRQVTASGNITVAAGTIVSIKGKLYLVERGVTYGRVFTLDTAYQGISESVTSGTTSSTFGTVATVNADTWGFVFTGIKQPVGDRHSQFRMVDFVVTYPKGFEVSGEITLTTTAPVQPIGSWKQVRDMEAKASTNGQPLINYREFPFEDFPLNVNLSATSATYAIFTLVHSAGGTGSYNFNQSNYREFPQTTVCAVTGAEAAVTHSGSPAAATDTFANALVGWYTKQDVPDVDNAVFGDTTF
jgi:hypothetical protein